MCLVGEFAQKCRPYLFIIKRGRKFIDGPDTGYSISCQNKNKFLGFCKLSIIELKLLTGISLNKYIYDDNDDTGDGDDDDGKGDDDERKFQYLP